MTALKDIKFRMNLRELVIENYLDGKDATMRLLEDYARSHGYGEMFDDALEEARKRKADYEDVKRELV